MCFGVSKVKRSTWLLSTTWYLHHCGLHAPCSWLGTMDMCGRSCCGPGFVLSFFFQFRCHKTADLDRTQWLSLLCASDFAASTTCATKLLLGKGQRWDFVDPSSDWPIRFEAMLTSQPWNSRNTKVFDLFSRFFPPCIPLFPLCNSKVPAAYAEQFAGILPEDFSWEDGWTNMAKQLTLFLRICRIPTFGKSHEFVSRSSWKHPRDPCEPAFAWMCWRGMLKVSATVSESEALNFEKGRHEMLLKLTLSFLVPSAFLSILLRIRRNILKFTGPGTEVWDIWVLGILGVWARRYRCF